MGLPSSYTAQMNERCLKSFWLKIQTPEINCDIDGGIDGPIATTQDLLTGPDTAPSLYFDSSKYWLQPPLSNRSAP